jgi:uncharacterized membrane protein
MSLINLLQVLFILFMPWALTRFTEKMGTENWLSPVVLCYLTGIAIRNLTSFPLSDALSKHITEASILLAIPLLLYSTDLWGWLKLAKSTLIGFTLQIVSVIISAAAIGWMFREILPEVSYLSGMLTAVFIGGTPNMNAVGMALEVKTETFVALNAVEIACGGGYLLLLTSVLPRLIAFILPAFEGDKHAGADEFLPKNIANKKDILLALGLTICLAGLAAGLTWLLAGSFNKPGTIILLLSVFSVAASFNPRIRNLGGAYETGEYCLLIFSITIGLMAEFNDLFNNGGVLLTYCALTLLLNVILHLLLCRLFRIDRDTMIITSTAGVFGPPFIGQVAAVLKNRSMVFSGIATGLIGIALANFFGILIGNFLHRWL